MSAFSGDDNVNYMISEILLKTCDMNKIAIFCEEFEKIKNELENTIGREEDIFLKDLKRDLLIRENELNHLKSRAWDEVFYQNKKSSFTALEDSFKKMVESSSKTYLEILSVTKILFDLYEKRKQFNKICVKLHDLLADLSHFMARESHSSIQNSDINVPGIIKLPLNKPIFDEKNNACSISIFHVIQKVRDFLIDTLEMFNKELVLAKSSTYDILYENITKTI